MKEKFFLISIVIVCFSIQTLYAQEAYKYNIRASEKVQEGMRSYQNQDKPTAILLMKEAISLYEKSIDLCKKQNVKHGNNLIKTTKNSVIKLESLLGKMYYEIDDYENAEKYLTHVINSQETFKGNQLELSNIYLVLGMSNFIKSSKYFAKNNSADFLSKAIYFYDKSLTIKKKLLNNNEVEIAELYYFIGICYYLSSKYEKAINPLKTSLKIYSHHLDSHRDEYYETYDKLFMSLDKSGYINEAKTLVKQQILRFGKFDNELTLNLLLDLTYIYSLESNISEISKVLYKANNTANSININDELKYKLAKGNFQYNIMLGNEFEALKHIMTCIDITKKLYGVASHQYIRECYNMTHIKINLYGWDENTFEHVENLIGLYKNINIDNDYMLSELYSLKVVGQIELRKLDDAISTIHTMFNVLKASDLPDNILDKKYGDYYFSLGYLYFEKEDYSQAEKYFKESLTKYQSPYNSNSISIATLKNNIAQVLRKQKKLKEANNYFLSSLNIAKDNFENLFYSTSEEEKEIYLNFKIPVLISGINEFATEYKNTNPDIIDEVYNNTLYFKNILLKSSSLMYNTIKKSNNSILIDKYKELTKLKKRITKLYESNGNNDEIKILKNNVNTIEKHLVSKSKELGYFIIDNNINWKNIRNNLKSNEVAIEFIDFYNDNTNQTEYYSLIVKKESIHPKMVFLFNEKQLNKILNNNSLNQKAINRQYGTKNQNNNLLYKYIWEPIFAEIDTENRLYYSKSGILHSISFACIRDNNGNFLIDNYELVNLNTTAEITYEKRININNIRNALLFGGIDYNNSNISNLKYSKIEVENIKVILANNNVHTELVSDSNATETKFKELASNNQLIHLATHGYFIQENQYKSEIKKRIIHRIDNTIYDYNNNPLLNSGLLFSTNQLSNNDGRLSAYEVSQLNLINTDLVILSACNSGLGEVFYSNEGVYGLHRSFKIAGVKKIIVSLWEVDDEKTKEFMINFYENLFATHNIRKAFRMTQKGMSKKYDPYYWGAFVLIE